MSPSLLSLDSLVNPLTPKSDLTDFTLSNARRFYSVQRQTILLCPTPDNFTLSNPRQFYSVQRQTILLRPMPDDFTRQRVKVDFFGRTLRHSESFKNGVFGAGAIFRLFPFLFLWRMHRIIRWRPTPQIAIGSRSQLVHRQSIRQGGKSLQSAANMSSLLHDTWPCLLVLNFFWQDFLHSIRGVLLGFVLSLTWIWKKVIYQ